MRRAVVAFASACAALAVALAVLAPPLSADDVAPPTPPAAGPPAGAPATATTPDPDSPFVNVQVLKHVRSKSEMRALMKEMSASLGVKCGHCHVQGDQASDDKESKRVARAMMRMTGELNAAYFPEATEPQVTCWTCHRGEKEPPHAIPREALDAADAMGSAPQ